MKRTSRATSKLSESVHHQLQMYALAAGAAGISALSLAPPADAKIIYTKTNTPILVNKPYNLDLNHDGISDFELKDHFYTNSGYSDGSLIVLPQKSANEVWTAQQCFGSAPSLCAARLRKGTRVGPKGAFRQDYPNGEIMVRSNHVSYFGKWMNATGYLGLKFVIKGKTHFGWARLAVSAQRWHVTATLTGYAYETIPGKAIIAGATKGPDDGEPTASFTMPTPEPATLGVLAMGSPGLSIWRRKERLESTQ
jgi:hypothetical protein